jgi:conjugal transfer mating pair stabilization protein TraN
MENIQKPIASLLIVCIFHNSIAAFYLLTLATFFVPFPAFADAFLDKAAEGEALGGTLMNGFSVPNVNSSTGQITLTNGPVAGQTIEQNAMFQEIQPGSIDAAAASYGDAAAQGTYVNNNIDSLKTGSSQHAYAYQTLMGANTAMPNMLNDPIWKQSDDVFTRTSPLINDMFSGCQKTTNWGETSCPIHIEDLKQCKKSLKTEKCTVTRALTYSPVMGFGSGIGNISSCGMGCTALTVGVVGDNYWGSDDGCEQDEWNVSFTVLRPDKIKKVTVYRVKYDDETRIFLNGNLAFTGQSGWGGCEHGTSFDDYPGTDITDAFKSAAVGGTVNVKQVTRVGGYGEGFSMLKVEAFPDIDEEFIDSPAGCRERLFNAWPLQGTAPTFISSGSLNDQASTEWWQCTDASNSKVVGPVTITPGNYTNYITGADILPAAPTVPPAPICYKADTRSGGLISLDCYTDYQGYQVCPQYNQDTNAHTTCDSLSSCAYVKEECEKDANGNELIDPITGACKDFIVTYDCGTDHASTCDLTNNGENTICDAQIRCMGGECVDPQQESNEDFVKAATALQTLNESQKQLSCNPEAGACKFFAGEAYTCQMADLSILGSVDCCNMPIGGSWIDYIWLAKNTWELADTSVEVYSIAENGTLLTDMVGSWNMVSTGTVFETPVGMIGDAYSAITDTFTSMYDSVATQLGEEIGMDLGLEAIQQQAVQWLGEWIAEIFGEAAASTLLSATAGTGAAIGTTTYSMAGSLLSSIVTVVGIIYAIYQIAKLVVQLIFACTEEEIKLQMYKNQRMCTKPDEIGTYCSAKFLGSCVAEKQTYCCFSSPFARVFQEQARKQMGEDFGEPLAPSCEGLTIEQIGSLDFDKMDFGEWINMLKVANVMPLDSAKADELYSAQTSTIGNLPGTQNQSVIDRINDQTQGSDIDAQRQYLLDNM